MPDTKLLPCPLCGHESILQGWINRLIQPSDAFSERFWGQCNSPDCGIEGPAFPTEDEAAAAWNTRALTPKQKAAEEMVTALEQIWKYAAHGTATKQKDARGRQFAAIHDLARAALAKAGQQ